MMNIYPAIDLYEGMVVRLSRGEFNQKTVYSENPVLTARQFENSGSSWLHVVDLEGAQTGQTRNRNTLLAIRQSVKCHIQFGGGVRTTDQIRDLLDAGIDRIVVGTKALDQHFLKSILDKHGARIAVGLDCKNGVIQTEGWLKDSHKSLQDFLKELNQYSLSTVIYTDIAKDGMLAGPNIEQFRQVLEWARMNVILSGGISSLNDIKQCLQIGHDRFDGVIVGKALYEQAFRFEEALKLIQTHR